MGEVHIINGGGYSCLWQSTSLQDRMASSISFQSKDVSVMVIVSAFVLQVFFFTPLQVLAQNFGEFSVGFIDVLVILLICSCAFIVVLWLGLRFFNNPLGLSTLTLLSTIGFLESRFLLALAQHRPFDGKPIDWDSLQWLSYLELVTILVLGVLFFAYRKRVQFLSTVSLFILVFLAAGFFYQVFINWDSLQPRRQASSVDSLYFEQFYRLSNKRNIIHIVPDQAQGAMLHEILNSDYEHYSSVFDGFTLFTQAVGRYKGTYPSMVYYMAGESPEPEYDLVPNQPYTWEYIEETLQQNSIVTLLSQNAFNTYGFQFHPGIFCKGPFTACTGTHDEVFGGMATNNPERRTAVTVLTALEWPCFK